MKNHFLIALLALVPTLCSAQNGKTTFGVYALTLDAMPNSYEEFKATGEHYIIFFDGISNYLTATLVMGSDTLRVKSDFPGHFEFGEVKPGEAKLIIENMPAYTKLWKFEPYSEQLTIHPGDNIAFVELKLQEEANKVKLKFLQDKNEDKELNNLSPEEFKKLPMPVRIEEDGLHYAVMTMLFNANKRMENETNNRLKSFPGLTIKPLEIVLAGDETKYYRFNDNTLIFNYLK